jgi:hypothetical protein
MPQNTREERNNVYNLNMQSGYSDFLSASHLKRREELCNRLHFPIPSSFLDCNNNGATHGAARRTPEAANFQKKRW